MAPSTYFPFFCSLVFTPGFWTNPIQCKPRLVINQDFPDPALLTTPDAYYAFGTNNFGKRVQVAKSIDFESWTVLDVDALAGVGPWEKEENTWAPGVIIRDDGRLVLYYSGVSKYANGRHCIGGAITEGTDPAGPYFPLDDPIACHIDNGGSIDAVGFLDQDDSRYVLYKIDGNAVGNGGDCGNSVPPLASTPIMLQKLEADAVTKIGDPMIILDRDDSDGPLVEAPSLVLVNGVYFLFYSSHCYSSPQYDVKYATSRSITGPYKKVGPPLLKTGDFGLTSPGHAEVSPDGTRMLFHANCEGKSGRCMYAMPLFIHDETVSILGRPDPLPAHPEAPSPPPQMNPEAPSPPPEMNPEAPYSSPAN
ncbi:hypothetical protein FQN50_001778 [Emmonsiellopsis sp. PD_5]|nr:hypothetical protein FQN50_001778 [Emmonsiellopsis sp. PD_5]